jgi:small nuclear ribonucleoprotein (snRNP)-like protein
MAEHFPVSRAATAPPLRGLDSLVAHQALMRAAGWTRSNRIVPGERVLVSLDNGFETWGVIQHVYKNGNVRIDEEHEEGKGRHRSPCNLYVPCETSDEQ